MGKLIVLACAVMGAVFCLPRFFPFLTNTAFMAGQYPVSYGIIVVASVFVLGMGLKAA